MTAGAACKSEILTVAYDNLTGTDSFSHISDLEAHPSGGYAGDSDSLPFSISIYSLHPSLSYSTRARSARSNVSTLVFQGQPTAVMKASCIILTSN